MDSKIQSGFKTVLSGENLRLSKKLNTDNACGSDFGMI